MTETLPVPVSSLQHHIRAYSEMFFAPGLVSANYRLQARNAPIEHKTVLRDMIHRNNREPPDNIPNSTTDRMARI